MVAATVRVCFSCDCRPIDIKHGRRVTGRTGGEGARRCVHDGRDGMRGMEEYHVFRVMLLLPVPPSPTIFTSSSVRRRRGRCGAATA